jgi:hypothetical protein
MWSTQKADKQMTPSHSEEVKKILEKRIFSFLTLFGGQF